MKVLLIGTSQMAKDYAKVLNKLDVKYDVVGRGQSNADLFEKEFGIKPILGLENIDNPNLYSHAIVAVSTNQLITVASQLLELGITNILLEKPGSTSPEEFNRFSVSIRDYPNIFIAYNRRFFQSVLSAKKMIEEDGGVNSFFFDFTEWSHIIADLQTSADIKRNWLYANSTHIIDLAFHLGGKPIQMHSYAEGKNSLDWHPSSAKFSGAGITASNTSFAYASDWTSPGRWRCEINTTNYKFIFCPIEKLNITKKGSVAVELLDLDYSLDEDFKPGLFLQTKCFIENDFDQLKNHREHCQDIQIFNTIINGSK